VQRLKSAEHSKTWVVASLILGPLVWLPWCYKQRASDKDNIEVSVLIAIDAIPQLPAASAPPLDDSILINKPQNLQQA